MAKAGERVEDDRHLGGRDERGDGAALPSGQGDEHEGEGGQEFLPMGSFTSGPCTPVGHRWLM